MGSFIDERDGYEWVKIGNQTWMAENLRIQENNIRAAVMGEEIANIYGEFYEFSGCCCPSGWRVPKLYDWENLVNYFGRKEVAGKYLKDNSGLLWESSNYEANNNSKFSIIPGGFIIREIEGASLFYNHKEPRLTDFFIVNYEHLPTRTDYSTISFNYDSSVFFLDIFDGVTAPVHNIRCIKE